MSLLKTKAEDLFININSNPDKGKDLVNDPNRKSSDNSSDIAALDKEVSLGGNEVYHEDTINEKYSQYLDTLKIVAESNGITYSELADSIDRVVNTALSNKELDFSDIVSELKVKEIYDNPIIKSITEEIIQDILWEASPVSMDDLSEKELKSITKITEVLNKSSTRNVKPIDMFKGIHGLIVIYELGNVMAGFRFDKKDLVELSKLSFLRWIESDKVHLNVGI